MIQNRARKRGTEGCRLFSSLRLASAITLGIWLSLSMAGGAEALSISGVTVTPSGSNTADFTDDNGADSQKSQNLSSTAITAFTPPSGSVPDTLGSSVSFSTRYASLLAADADTGNLTRQQVSAYDVQFTVNAAAGVKYVVTIDTRRVGDLTVINDTSGNSGTSASLGAVTGKVNGGANDPLLGLPSDSFTGPNGNSNGNKAFNQNLAGVLTLQGVGTQVFTLSFTWTDSVTGNPASDEVAIRMGLSGTLTGVTADDYPGTPSRTLTCNGTFTNCDGHFVDVTVDVPHPPTLSLLGLGLAAGGSGVCWRRLRRR